MIVIFKFKGKRVEIMGVELDEFDCRALAQRLEAAAKQLSYYVESTPTKEGKNE